MLLDPDGWDLAQAIDDVLPRLPGRPRAPHERRDPQGAIELATEPRGTVGGRRRPARGPARRAWPPSSTRWAWRAAAAGTHPYGRLAATPACRPPSPPPVHLPARCASWPAASRPSRCTSTSACDGPEDAIGVVNRLRAHLPLLLALSANSPFWQGRDAGLASARTPLFQASSRASGIPRRFASYED